MEKRLHVLVLPEFLPYKEKGWGGFTWNYIKSITPFCDVTVFHSRLNGAEKGVHEEQIDKHIRLIRYFPYKEKPIGFKKKVAYYKWLKDAFKLSKKIEGVDVIHAHGAFLNGSLAKKLAVAWDVPYVLTEHTGPFSKVVNNPLKKFAVKRIMSNANAVLAVSEHLKREILANKIQLKRLEVTYNPVDTELFQLKKDQLYKNIVFAGRMDENKGALRAVKAFELFYKDHPDWTLTLCGGGREMQLIQKYILTHQMDKVVILKGMLSEEEVAAEFQQADIFISPTAYESFGLAIAEAMSCGLPVITTNQTAPPEYIDASSGILLNTNDVSEMAKALSLMAENIHQYNQQKIRRQIVTQFSVSNFGERLLTIYKSL
ncbi:MAG: glycosyltransferase [Vicingus serpentipes]|nr:glycosyltransferase [Vicingus serpentipes]